MRYEYVGVQCAAGLLKEERLTIPCTGTVAFTSEGVNSITIQSSRATCTEVHSVGGSSALIVTYKKSSQSTKNLTSIRECVRMLRSGRHSAVVLLEVLIES
jgi:hypothetical protein